MSQARGRSASGGTERVFLWRTIPWGTRWGQMDGPSTDGRPHQGALRRGVGRLDTRDVPSGGNYLLPPFRGRLAAAGASFDVRSPVVFKIVTWLILPVVICLSQRLSHACLSISNHTVKLRMAH